MREILFRGKESRENGGFVEGAYYHQTEFYGDKEFNKRVKVDEHYIITSTDELEDNMMTFSAVFPETVGQYTGLTDKNGTKIFEGDECRLTRHCILCYGSITFKKGSFWFEEFNTDSVIGLNRLKPNNFEIEVIGNIHDNPELLRGDN